MRTRSFLLSVAACLLVATAGLAQGNPTGKLSGRVTSDGQPLPGVRVTVVSPNLQGTRSALTSANGDYIFAALPPGEYTVTYELEGMEPATATLRLSAAQATEHDVALSASRVEESIVVTGELTTISQGTQAATTYTNQLIDQLPVGRSVADIVALSPGVHATGPAKGTANRLGSITISGANSYENLFLVNGVVLNENLRGQPFDLFIEDAIQETTTATAGVSAEYGRFQGGVVNVITKSGGNEFSGSARVGLTNQKWEKEIKNDNFADQHVDDRVPTYEATLGGPVMRDRIWFFGAGRKFDRVINDFTRFTNEQFPVGNDQKRYEGKLTGSVTDAHTLVASYLKIDETERGNFFGTILDTASVVDRELPQELRSLNYNGVLGDNFFLVGQYSEREFTFINSGSRFTDLTKGTLLLDRSRSNARYHAPTFCGVCRPEGRNNKNYLGKLSYFLSTEGSGSHEFTGGYDHFDDVRISDNHQSGSDYRILGTGAILRGADIFPVFLPGSTIIQYNPIFKSSEGTHFVTNSMYVNDSWRLNERLSFTLGLRYDKNDGANAEGTKVAKDNNLSPRLAVAYDPSGNGDWQFQASYGQYVAAIANSIGDGSSSAGAPATFQWTYNGPAINADPNAAVLVGQDDAINQTFAWFNSVGGPDGAPGLILADIPGGNTLIRGSLDSPNVREYSVGLTKRLGRNGLVRTDYVHRKFGDFYQQRADLETGQIDTRNGRQDLNLIENSNEPERTYNGIHTQFRYKFAERLDLGGNWTWSHAEGDFEGENRASGPLSYIGNQYPEYKEKRWNTPKGDLAIDQRHKLNFYAVYEILRTDRNSLAVSLTESYASGRPYEALGQVRSVSYVAPEINAAYRSEPARVDYFFTGRGALKTPAVTATDLSLNYGFTFKGVNLFLQPEILNVFDERKIDTTDSRYFDASVFTADNTSATRLCSAAGPGGTPGACTAFNPFTTTPVEGVNWQKGPQFGEAINALGYQRPRTFRVSLGLKF